VTNDSVDKNTPYLPERYKQHIRAKKQRRFLKKIFIACVGITILALVGLLLLGTLPVILQNTTQNQTAVKVQSPQPSDNTSALSSSIGRPANPVLDLVKARSIADRYISDHNSDQLQLNTTESRYELPGTTHNQSTGQYVFYYERMFQDIPCDNEGFVVSVDSVTGEVTDYQRLWVTPEYAFSVLAVPLITKREATFAIIQKANDTYPDSVGSVRITTAETMWMTRHQPGTIPRPGSIPLGWKIQFDDDVIRTNQSSRPAVGWIDTQTGALLDFSYRH
jgi:hypothetical protein